MQEPPNQPDEGARSRGGDTVGELTNALLDNPLLRQALSSALGVGEMATQAQRRAMDAVGLPSADDMGRLERRLRSLSDRLENLEDQLDEQERELSGMREKVATMEKAAEQQRAAEAETAAAETEPAT